MALNPKTIQTITGLLALSDASDLIVRLNAQGIMVPTAIAPKNLQTVLTALYYTDRAKFMAAVKGIPLNTSKFTANQQQIISNFIGSLQNANPTAKCDFSGWGNALDCLTGSTETTTAPATETTEPALAPSAVLGIVGISFIPLGFLFWMKYKHDQKAKREEKKPSNIYAYGMGAIAVIDIGVIIYGAVAKKTTKTGGSSTTEGSGGVLSVLDSLNPLNWFKKGGSSSSSSTSSSDGSGDFFDPFNSDFFKP